MMAAAVSVSAAARKETPIGLNFTPRPLHESFDPAVEHENVGFDDRGDSELEANDDDSATGYECPRRVDEELTALSPEEIGSRLERTRREFYNRRKMIIKNLPSDVSNQEVHEMLSNYDLKYCFVDKYKGTAFVTLLNGEQAQCAIKEFHQHLLRDREISVQLQPTDALLCIANLPHAFSQQQFEELVRPFGNLERCFLVHSASTGHSKGYGFVEYMKKDSAAKAKSELLGKQLGSRMLYVHWTEVGSLTYPLLHSRCLCVDRLPPSLLTAQDLRNALADTHAPMFCQLAQGQDGSFRRFAVLEFATAEMAEDVQRTTGSRVLGGTPIRVSFCAPGPPGRSMLAALIAAQTMALNRGKGLLPEPTAMQILTGLSNPATLKMLLNPMTQGRKQGLLGAAPTMPLLANPALSAALLQLLLQNQAQVQQQAFLGNHLLWAQVLHNKENRLLPCAGLMGDNPLAALPLQQGLHLLGDLAQGGVVPGLNLQTDPLGPVKPSSLGRTLGREQESPTAPCSFSQTPSPTLHGLSMPLLGGMLGAEGLPAPTLSILGDPLKDVNLSQNLFLNAHSLFPSSGASCRPHPYRKRPTLGNASNQRATHSIHSNYSLRYQESYTPDYHPLHQDPLAHLYDQQEVLEIGALTGFGQQRSHLVGFSELSPPYSFPPSLPLSSHFNSGHGAPGPDGLPSSHLNKVVGMPPVCHNSYPPGLGNGMKTPIGGHKRLFSHLIPSPEPSPEGAYVGQHSQGLGGHYADSYLKRKRIF
ncbi:ribonucleoprotein PTB-binding 1 isoform X2 [Hypomesus transpacificus]|uniref:ribonucleoprotein PTB-binding 1 isoform X2 n=1 Tax=Hypomesus transpacificus TaxID=137520 RepID=UPI001F07BAD4|nr:ribonucleoprotein PTB-binding 1 isoform X2 [Hypomesus transpacificus]